MARFQVIDTFPIENRELFVIAGAIVEGEIRPGMFVRIPLGGVTVTARIDSIEFARHQEGREDVCLCIRYSDSDELGLWRAFDIGADTLDVTTEGSE